MTDVRLQLIKDHAELDALLRCLSEDTVAPECGALQATWSKFETRLLAHMDGEERFLLPAPAHVQDKVAAAFESGGALYGGGR